MLLHPTSQVSAWYLVISSHGMVNISKGEPQLAAIHRYALLFSKTKKKTYPWVLCLSDSLTFHKICMKGFRKAKEVLWKGICYFLF